MRKTALIIAAGFAALTVSASVGQAQTRVVAKKPVLAPVQTTFGAPKAGVAGGVAKPAAGTAIKIAPNAGAGLVAAGGGNLVAAGGGNFKRP